MKPLKDEAKTTRITKKQIQELDYGLCSQLHTTTRGNYFHYWYKNKCYLVVRLK